MRKYEFLFFCWCCVIWSCGCDGVSEFAWIDSRCFEVSQTRGTHSHRLTLSSLSNTVTVNKWFEVSYYDRNKPELFYSQRCCPMPLEWSSSLFLFIFFIFYYKNTMIMEKKNFWPVRICILDNERIKTHFFVKKFDLYCHIQSKHIQRIQNYGISNQKWIGNVIRFKDFKNSSKPNQIYNQEKTLETSKRLKITLFVFLKRMDFNRLLFFKQATFLFNFSKQ